MRKALFVVFVFVAVATFLIALDVVVSLLLDFTWHGVLHAAAWLFAFGMACLLLWFNEQARTYPQRRRLELAEQEFMRRHKIPYA